jgi:glycosyltransferase involved in cell wall biosynthesis
MTRPLRVLHAPAEIAGQAATLARALRGLGVDAHSLAYNQGFPQYQTDESLGYDTKPLLQRYAGYARTLARNLGRWDVYHFHFGRTLIPPRNLDLPLYKAMGRTVVFHYHGCDVRNRAHMIATHARATCTECAPFCIPKLQARILESARHHVDAELVSTPDLLESVPNARHLPVATDLEALPFAPPRGAPKLVVHAPTNRLIKGTRHVAAAFEKLERRFPGVRFVIAERLPWRELMRLMADADVIVDQLFMGWYGMVAVEAMAMGKPVLCSIRPDFEPRLRDCPIVRVTIEDLEQRLAEALTGADRETLGTQGRAYVEREHAAPIVATQLLALYRELRVERVRA